VVILPYLGRPRTSGKQPQQQQRLAPFAIPTGPGAPAQTARRSGQRRKPNGGLTWPPPGRGHCSSWATDPQRPAVQNPAEPGSSIRACAARGWTPAEIACNGGAQETAAGSLRPRLESPTGRSASAPSPRLVAASYFQADPRRLSSAQGPPTAHPPQLRRAVTPMRSPAQKPAGKKSALADEQQPSPADGWSAWAPSPSSSRSSPAIACTAFSKRVGHQLPPPIQQQPAGGA